MSSCARSGEEPAIVVTVGVVSMVVLSLVAGCASGRDWRQVYASADYPFRQVREDVTLVVDPWLDGNDQREAFGTKVSSDRILPLRVILYNNTETTIRFSATQASLTFPNGQTLQTMPQSDVSARIQDSESVLPVIISVASLGYGRLVARAVSGAIAADNWNDQQAVRSASMELVRLDPGQAMSGFLFFDAGKLLKSGLSSNKHRLCIRRITRGDALPLSFEVEFKLSEEN